MKTLTDKDLRELDAWIAVNLFGFVKLSKKPHPTDNRQIDGALYSPNADHDCGQESVVPYYHHSPTAAMQVLEKCIHNCYKDCKTVSVRECGEGYAVFARDNYDRESAEAETLALAISLFAKKIFS